MKLFYIKRLANLVALHCYQGSALSTYHLPLRHSGFAPRLAQISTRIHDTCQSSTITSTELLEAGRHNSFVSMSFSLICCTSFFESKEILPRTLPRPRRLPLILPECHKPMLSCHQQRAWDHCDGLRLIKIHSQGWLQASLKFLAARQNKIKVLLGRREVGVGNRYKVCNQQSVTESKNPGC